MFFLCPSCVVVATVARCVLYFIIFLSFVSFFHFVCLFAPTPFAAHIFILRYEFCRSHCRFSRGWVLPNQNRCRLQQRDNEWNNSAVWMAAVRFYCIEPHRHTIDGSERKKICSTDTTLALIAILYDSVHLTIFENGFDWLKEQRNWWTPA